MAHGELLNMARIILDVDAPSEDPARIDRPAGHQQTAPSPERPARRSRPADRPPAPPSGRARPPRQECPAPTNGTGTCTMPSAPPTSITPTKAQGQTHKRAAAFERRPQADRDHHRHVVEAAERMRDAGGE